MTATTGQRFEPTAWAWVQHLRAGGSTPWLTWADAEHPTPAGAGSVLPGAAQLEVVRRLADRQARSGAAVDFPGLADLVFDRSAPGRGMPRLPLLWPPDGDGAGNPRGIGAPPADPARVPVKELIRVAEGVLADLLDRGVWPEPAEPQRPPRRWPWSRSFRLVGAPTTAARARAGFAAAGHAEGGWRPRVVLFAPPLDVLLSQVWSGWVQRGAAIRWRMFVGSWATRDALPPAADVIAVAARWRDRVGAANVHVVTGSPDGGWHDQQARRTAASVLDLSIAEPTEPVSPRSLPVARVAALRRLNRLLRVRPDADRTRLLHRAVPLLGGEEPTGMPGLRVPDQHRDWVEDRARTAIERLRAEDYAVHGDLDQIAPTGSGRVRPRWPQVLDEVLDACLQAAERAT